MYSSQLKKQSSSRKSTHPGTPRPNPENFSYHSPSRREPRESAATEEVKFLSVNANFKPRGKPNKDDQQQRNCGLPKHPSSIHVAQTHSSESLPDFLVWVKNEPFDFGILSPLPCPKIGINILRKIAEYCRDKPGHYPELSLNQWNHICKYKMQLATDLSFTYFRVFDIITRSISTWTHNPSKDERKQAETVAASAADGGESWDLKFHKVFKQGNDINDDFKVDTMQFLLFLYIQHFLRLHKKYFRRPYGDEPWPKTLASSLMLRNGAGSGVNIPEQQQAEFVMTNLPDIIDFLMLLHEKSQSSQADDKSEKSKQRREKEENILTINHQRITVDVVKALSLILGVASTIPNTEFKTLDECLHLPGIRWKLEYSKYSKTVDRKCFIQWVVKNLKINPWGPSSVPIPQHCVPAMTGVWDEVECFKQNKIFWNTQSYPKSWFLISGVEKQVLMIDSLEPMSSIKIHRCTNSFIFLPGVHNYILVQKCHGITINLGVTTKAVKFVECSGITVSAVGRQFIISDVSLSTFHLLTPSSPIVCGSKNHQISLAPYNTTYPHLTSHMKAAGISAKIQRWNRPLEIANDGFPRAFQPSNVLPLILEQFKMFHFPFKISESSSTDIMTGSSFSINLPPPLPGTLPTAYQRRVDGATEKTEEARKQLASNQTLTGEDINLIYQITLQRFKKWLRESGHYELVVGLRSYEKSMEQESSLPIVCSKGHDLSCVARALRKFFDKDVDTAGSRVKSVRSTLSISSERSRSRHSRHEDKGKNRKAEKGRHALKEGCREDVFPRHHTKSTGGAGDQHQNL